MKAAVYHGAHDVRLEQRPVPVRAPGEALLKVLRSGICGTDATEWRAGPIIFPVAKVHPVTGLQGPMIFGHEFIGEIVEADPDSGLAAGTIVASGAGISCGKCDRCREGRTNICERYYTLGLNAPGGMAEYVSCPVSALVAVPEGLSVDYAGLAQPLAVGLHAARRARAAHGDTVVLLGAGAIGSFVLAGLLSLAEVDVTVVEFPGGRQDRASRLGAKRVVDAGEGMVDRVLGALGAKADIVIEASGAPGQLNNAIALTRDGGTILQVGMPSTEQLVDIHELVFREITLRTTLAHVCRSDLAPALKILQNTDLGVELLDSVHPLEDIAEQLDRLATGKLEGKVLFVPTVRSERPDVLP